MLQRINTNNIWGEEEKAYLATIVQLLEPEEKSIEDDCFAEPAGNTCKCQQCKNSIVHYTENKAVCDELDCLFTFKEKNLKSNYKKFPRLYPEEFDGNYNTLGTDYAQKLKKSSLLDPTQFSDLSQRNHIYNESIKDPLLLLKLCEEVINLDDKTYEKIQNDTTHQLHLATEVIAYLLDLETHEFEKIKQNPKHFAYYIANILDEEEEDRCALCCEYETKQRPFDGKCEDCRHVFHADELNKWVIRDNRCPICREVCKKQEVVDNLKVEAEARGDLPAADDSDDSDDSDEDESDWESDWESD